MRSKIFLVRSKKFLRARQLGLTNHPGIINFFLGGPLIRTIKRDTAVEPAVNIYCKGRMSSILWISQAERLHSRVFSG
jgi:hypothetical protein